MAGKPDPKLCWSCGEPGEPHIGSMMKCGECDVTWMPWAAPPCGSLPAALASETPAELELTS